MLNNISYFLIFGKPIMMYLGILTFTSLVCTATAGYLVTRGKVNFRVHKILAAITLSIAITHGTLGIMAYF